MQYAVVKDGFEKKFTKIHESLEAARAEADRLVALENKPFLVLQVLERRMYAERPIEVEDLRGET